SVRPAVPGALWSLSCYRFPCLCTLFLPEGRWGLSPGPVVGWPGVPPLPGEGRAVSSLFSFQISSAYSCAHPLCPFGRGWPLRFERLLFALTPLCVLVMRVSNPQVVACFWRRFVSLLTG